MSDEQDSRSRFGVSILTLAIWCHHGVIATPAGAAPPASESPDRPLPLDRWTYTRADDNRGKWGDTAEPGWLRYFGLAT